MKLRTYMFLIVFTTVTVYLLIYWQKRLEINDTLVVYFGRPSDIWSYVTQHWSQILEGSILSTGVALVSLLISAGLAVIFLVLGLSSEGWLRSVERFAAISQTIPILVIVTISFIVEKSLLKKFGLDLGLAWYCFIPVSIALFFPPLVYGIKGVRDIDSNMKALLRIWDAPQSWRIKRIYLPQVLPHILTGLRVSSTWAVVATLITEGLIYGVGGNQYSIGKGLMRPFSGSLVAGQTPTLVVVATLLGFLVYYIVGGVQVLVQKKVFGLAVEQEKNYPITG